MKIPLVNIRPKMMAQLSETIFNSKQSRTYLQALILNRPYPNVWIILLGLIFCIITIENSSWQGSYLYLLFGGVLAFLITWQIQKWIRWKKLGKDAVFFDPLYFTSIKGEELEIIPLSDYLSADIMLSSDRLTYLARFHFKGKTVLQTCASNIDINVLNFQSKLFQYSTIVRQSKEGTKVPRYLSESFVDKISANQNPIIITGFILILLFFTIPIIIDSNQFNTAKDLNTATSYRSYLSEPKNIRHRDEARIFIKKIYNLYLNKYANQAVNSKGANSFQKVLEYLRDKNLYSLRLIFLSKSEVSDISNYEYQTVSVTPSFSLEKNISRQDDVSSALKSSLGTIFPSDVLTLATEDVEELPKLEVSYTYKNQENSLYYSEKEENIPEKSRTWYYGIEIDWYFKLFIPTQKNSLYEFKLVSKPAPRFTSESFSPDAVYNNMAISAFNDFRTEFQRQFLNW
jgi:hypothetical protein